MNPKVYPLTHWDEHFMKMAVLASEMSDDRSTKVGCVIVKENVVVATGCNTFPRGCYVSGDDRDRADAHRYSTTSVVRHNAVEARHDKPAKYLWTEHAERNAIYNVARFSGTSLLGCGIYVPWFPCADCARAIIQAGITQVVAYLPDFEHPKYGPDFKVAVQMFGESGVQVRYVERLAEAPKAA
jgi:dCMP deaminase